jgi:hypothetical protein
MSPRAFRPDEDHLVADANLVARVPEDARPHLRHGIFADLDGVVERQPPHQTGGEREIRREPSARPDAHTRFGNDRDSPRRPVVVALRVAQLRTFGELDFGRHAVLGELRVREQAMRQQRG